MPSLANRQLAKTFILPGLAIFVIPLLSYAFFWYAQARYDGKMRESLLTAIDADQGLSNREKEHAAEFAAQFRLSQHLADSTIAKTVNPDTLFDYAIFQWMLWLSAASVGSGIAIFLFVGICVCWSLRSHLAQYWCLLIGWHVLRIYGIAQSIVFGVLIVALSYWIPALWFEVYVQKLILIAAGISLGGCVAVIYGFFLRVPHDFFVDGMIVSQSDNDQLWLELNSICAKVGTSPPNQVIAGIDDNFFATESPVTVNGKTYHGKTLYVSLPLLKQLDEAEAETILAHEMAHFSGGDTFYSRKISPLIRRYEIYLSSLADNPFTVPVFLFMRCFRAMFELSLGRLSRQREFRADQVAATVTSPGLLATSLLRTAAYSRFRNSIETELIEQQQTLDLIDVPGRIERGFTTFIAEFMEATQLNQSAIPHPFDTHPPIIQRLAAVGVEHTEDSLRTTLRTAGNGAWYHRISNASELEQELWAIYEEQFQVRHQESLPYRLLPETPEEQVLVEAAFPALSFKGTKGTLTIDFEKVHYQIWADALYYREITKCEFVTERVFEIYFERRGRRNRFIDFGHFDEQQRAQFLAAFQNYHARQATAAKYNQAVKAKKSGKA